MRRSTLIASLLALVVALAAARPALAQAPLDGFDPWVARAVADWKVPGLAVLVLKNGQVVFSKGYGVRAIGAADPVDDRTLFAIGSTTKAMTAALVGMLVDEKKVSWDDPVARHLPWFRLKDPYATREATVRDLLTHRAGLGNADFLWYGQAANAREILQRAALIEPAYSFRASFVYQNVMYAAAGALVEAVGGRPWGEMLRARVLDPLGMTDTQPTAAALATRPNVARPHAMVGGALVPIENASVDNVAAAGSVWSSVSEMSRWMGMLLNGGAAGGAVLLQPGTVAELFKPQTIVTAEAFYPTARLTKPKWTTYGLGWFQQDYRGRAVDFHTGSIDGMVAIHALLRDERLGVMVLANRDHAEVRHAIVLDVFDRYIGGARRDWSAELKGLYDGLEREGDEARRKEEAARVAGTKPSLPLAEYAGTYRDALRGEVVVTVDGGRLHARYGGAWVGPLEHWHYDTFKAAWEARWRGPALATFVLDERGRASAIQLLGGRFTRAANGPPSRDR